MTSLTPPGIVPQTGQVSPLTASSLSMGPIGAPIGAPMSVSPAGIGVSPVKPVSPVLPVTPGSSGLVNPVLPLNSGSPGLINPASPNLMPMTSGLANPSAPMPSLVNPQLGPLPPVGLQRNLFPPHPPPPLPMHQSPVPSMPFGPVQQSPPPLVPHSTIMTVPAAPAQYVQQMQPAVVVQQPATHYAPQPQIQVVSPHPPAAAVVQTVPMVGAHYIPQPAPPTQYVVTVPPPPPPPPPLPPSIMSVHYPPVGPTTYARLR